MANRKTKSPRPSAQNHSSASASTPRNRFHPISAKQLRGQDEETIYRRLCRNRRVAAVKTWLLKHEMTEPQFDLLLQMVCVLPSRMKELAAYRQALLPELKQFRRALQELVESTRRAPGLEGFLIDLEVNVPGAPARARTLRLLLESVGAQIDDAVASAGTTRHLKPSARQESDRRSRPLSLASVVSLEIFYLLRRLLPPRADSDAVLRGLNQNAEMLASVVLNKPIRKATVSRLRDAERRKYGAREKNAR